MKYRMKEKKRGIEEDEEYENEYEEEFNDIIREVPLEELRCYRAIAENGKLIFIPRVLRYGAEVVWEARIHIKGAMGPVRLTKESIKAIGAPPEWYVKGKHFREFLQNKFPVLPEATELKELKELPGE